MSNWSGFILTAKGKELEALVAQGKTKLTFKSIVLGNGYHSDVSAATELANQIVSTPITSISQVDGAEAVVVLQATTSSQLLTSDLVVRELGVTALDMDGNEFLYCIDVDSNPDTIPVSSTSFYEQVHKIYMTVSSVARVQVVAESGSTIVVNNSSSTKRVVMLADGVSCQAGDLIGYKTGGYVKCDNLDYTTLKNILICLEDSLDDGSVEALTQGEFTVSGLEDGADVFVGSDGAYTTTAPTASGSFIKIVGVVEGDTIQFRPDSIAVQLS